MIYKIYKEPRMGWSVEYAEINPRWVETDWKYLETFPFRWLARRFVKKRLKGRPVPRERFVEFHS